MQSLSEEGGGGEPSETSAGRPVAEGSKPGLAASVSGYKGAATQGEKKSSSDGAAARDVGALKNIEEEALLQKMTSKLEKGQNLRQMERYIGRAAAYAKQGNRSDMEWQLREAKWLAEKAGVDEPRIALIPTSCGAKSATTCAS